MISGIVIIIKVKEDFQRVLCPFDFRSWRKHQNMLDLISRKTGILRGNNSNVFQFDRGFGSDGQVADIAGKFQLPQVKQSVWKLERCVQRKPEIFPGGTGKREPGTEFPAFLGGNQRRKSNRSPITTGTEKQKMLTWNGFSDIGDRHDGSLFRLVHPLDIQREGSWCRFDQFVRRPSAFIVNIPMRMFFCSGTMEQQQAAKKQ
ncbi:MAG: hypothetical protein PHS41_01305 [Victivallaceae bacterium]|nr:hypothetical protein [Victivallaceae bacterium]